MSEKVDATSVVNLLKIIKEKRDNGIDLTYLCTEGLLKNIILDFCNFGNQYNLINDICRFFEIYERVKNFDFSIPHDDFIFFESRLNFDEKLHFHFHLADERTFDFLKKYKIKQTGVYQKGIFTVHKGGKR